MTAQRSPDWTAYQSVHARARRLGLRLQRRQGKYSLLDRHGAVLAMGRLAVISVHIDELRAERRRQPANGWAPLIDTYLQTLAAAGQRAATRTLRYDHLRHMSRGLDCPPEEVTAELLLRWFGENDHWMPETRRGYRSAAKGFFTWMYKTGRIPVYLGDDLPKVRQPKAMPRPVPDDVWAAALAAAKPRTRLMLRLSAEVGLRRSEVAQVQTRDVLLAAGLAQLVVHGKGGKQRVVPISDELAEVILQGAAGHTSGGQPQGWLFPNGQGGHLHPWVVGQLVSGVLPQGYTMHALRHRFATRAYRGSRNLRAVQKLLGHASITATELYTAVDDDEIRAAAAAAWGDAPGVGDSPDR